MRMLFSIALAFLVSVQSGFGQTGPNQKRKKGNEALAARIREAIKKKVPITEIESFVKVEAAINTARSKADKNAWARANIGIDPQMSEINEFRVDGREA